MLLSNGRTWWMPINLTAFWISEIEITGLG
jgi:hypothetical protein